MEKICDCDRQRSVCPDQRELRGGSQWPDMTCEQILKGLSAMAKRIIDNSDAAGIEGLSQDRFIERRLNDLTENTNLENVTKV